MAKKSGLKKSAAKTKAAKKPTQEIIVSYKADKQTAPEVRAWLEGLAEHIGAPVTVTVDMALKNLAIAHGFRPMPKRLVK